MLHYDANVSSTKCFSNSNFIDTINETKMTLKIYKKRRIIYATAKQKMKFSVKDFIVNVIKSTFSCVIH